jgi:moderate conductance mechanosensitive channel
MEYIDIIYNNKLTHLVIGGILAWLAVFITKKSVHNFFSRTSFIEVRKEKTIESMINSIVKYAATLGFIFYALSLFITDFTRLLAGAGVIGIIVGFGAQSLIRDILSGLFLIYEKQLHKGDFIAVNNTFTGTVEEIGIRFLKVREWSGKLLTISNGEVKQIQNYNIDRMRVIEKVVVSYRENPSTVFEVLQKACDKLNANFDHCLKRDHDDCVVEPFQIYGMTSLNSNYRGYEYTVVALVDDTIYWTAGKETRKIIAQTFYEHHVKLAEENLYFQNKAHQQESLS